MPKIPHCIMCFKTPAELALFGKPICEACAHDLVSKSAAKNRHDVAERAVRESERTQPLTLVERDGVSYVRAGNKLYPALDAPDGTPVIEL